MLGLAKMGLESRKQRAGLAQHHKKFSADRWYELYAWLNGEALHRKFSSYDNAVEVLMVFDQGWINTVWYRYDIVPEEYYYGRK
jgi:hypothetical protein